MIRSGKSYSYWLARFNRKFPWIVPLISDRSVWHNGKQPKILQSAIETYAIIFLILTDDSTLLSHKTRMFTLICFKHGWHWTRHDNITDEKFMEEVARYECVYNRNSKNFKGEKKRLTVRKKSARYLIYLLSSWIFFESKTDVSFGFQADVVVA